MFAEIFGMPDLVFLIVVTVFGLLFYSWLIGVCSPVEKANLDEKATSTEERKEDPCIRCGYLPTCCKNSSDCQGEEDTSSEPLKAEIVEEGNSKEGNSKDEQDWSGYGGAGARYGRY